MPRFPFMPWLGLALSMTLTGHASALPTVTASSSSEERAARNTEVRQAAQDPGYRLDFLKRCIESYDNEDPERDDMATEIAAGMIGVTPMEFPQTVCVRTLDALAEGRVKATDLPGMSFMEKIDILKGQ